MWDLRFSWRLVSKLLPSGFLQSPAYQTTWHHSPDDHNIGHKTSLYMQPADVIGISHLVQAKELVLKTVNPVWIFPCLAHTSFLPQSQKLWMWGIRGLHIGGVSTLCCGVSKPSINSLVTLSLEINRIFIFAALWDVEPCRLVEVCWNCICHDDGGNRSVWNVGACPPSYIALS